MPEVSVIMPLYGQHRGQQTLRTVTEAWLDQEQICEVIVVVAGDLSIDVANDADGARTVRVVRTKASDGVRCLLLNLGALHARAPVLYMSDADIVPLGRDFLARALHLADEQVLAQPWMYRLVGEDDQLGPRYQAPLPGQHCFVRAASDGSLHPISDEEFTWKSVNHGELRIEAPMVRRVRATAVHHQNDTQEWLMSFHSGGLLIGRQQFADLGGYCQRYIGWGGEDEDMLIKIADYYRLALGWRVDPTLTCLHFEHPRPYFGTPERAANLSFYAKRVAAGPASMVEQDIAALTRAGWYQCAEFRCRHE